MSRPGRILGLPIRWKQAQSSHIEKMVYSSEGKKIGPIPYFFCVWGGCLVLDSY